MIVLPKELVRKKLNKTILNSSENHEIYESILKRCPKKMIQAEKDVHLGYLKVKKTPANADNARKGYSSKTLRSKLGSIELK